jgi:tRNA(Ile)-lysidine synthase
MRRPPPDSLETHVAAWVVRQHLLGGVRRLGLAVSGGADSVALLRLLLPLCRSAGVEPVVLHFDHQLRGAASAADARFVGRLAQRLGVASQLGRADVPPAPPAGGAPAPVARPSVEMAARDARQAFFRAAARTARLDAIATGHTADDVAETLLLRLARGSGATGLSGLRPAHAVAGVCYVRPLLACTHQALCDWLRGQRQVWREDASNGDESIPRNRVRRVVLPWLEQHWTPALRPMLVQSAAILRDEDALLETLTRQELARITLPAAEGPPALHVPAGWSAAVPMALQRRVLRQWLLQAGGAAAAGWAEVEALGAHLAAPRAAWQLSLPGGARVQAADGLLHWVRPGQTAKAGDAADAGPAQHLPLPGTVVVAGVHVVATRSRGIVRSRGVVGMLPAVCSLDAAALRGKTVQVRTRRPGDRIAPLGMTGSKTLQDLFVDAKLPAAARARLPVLVVDDEVIWVPGYRVARAYAVRAPHAAAVRVSMVPVSSSCAAAVGGE